MSFSVSYIYQILDKYSGPLRRIDKVTQKYRQKVQQTEKAVGGLHTRMERARKSTDKLSGAMAGFGGAAAFTSIFKMSSRLEDSLSGVQRVMEFTGENTINSFRGDLEKMSLQLGRSTSTLADMSYAAGKLGITGRKDILTFVSLSAKMADSFDMAGDAASHSMGQIRAKLSLPMPQIKTLTDSLNFLADSTSASGENMINIIRRASGTFKGLEIKPTDIAGWAAFADIIETSPEVAASGLNRMFAILKTNKAMAEKMVAAPTETVKTLLLQLSKLDKVSQAMATEQIFGQETGRFVTKAVQAVARLDDTLTIAGSNKAIDSIQREFDTLAQRASFRTRQIAISFKQTMIVLGDHVKEFVVSVAPYLIKLSKFVKNFSKNHPLLIKIGLAFFAILTAISLVLVAMGPLTSIWKGFVFMMSVVGTVLSAVIATIGFLISPIGLAIVALIGLAYWLSKPGKLKDAWTNLKNAALGFGRAMVAVWGITKKVFTGDFGGAWTDSLNALKGIVSSIKDELASIDAYFDLIFNRKKKRAEKTLQEDVFKRLMPGGVLIPAPALGAVAKIDPASLVATINMPSVMSKMAPAALGTMGKTTPVTPSTDMYGRMARQEMVASRGAATNNRMELGGQIRVEALPGTRIDRATIKLNTGQNMAYV
jgi:TP901 family phage tail tape measure protein